MNHNRFYMVASLLSQNLDREMLWNIIDSEGTDEMSMENFRELCYTCFQIENFSRGKDTPRNQMTFYVNMLIQELSCRLDPMETGTIQKTQFDLLSQYIMENNQLIYYQEITAHHYSPNNGRLVVDALSAFVHDELGWNENFQLLKTIFSFLIDASKQDTDVQPRSKFSRNTLEEDLRNLTLERRCMNIQILKLQEENRKLKTHNWADMVRELEETVGELKYQEQKLQLEVNRLKGLNTALNQKVKDQCIEITILKAENDALVNGEFEDGLPEPESPSSRW